MPRIYVHGMELDEKKSEVLIDLFKDLLDYDPSSNFESPSQFGAHLAVTVNSVLTAIGLQRGGIETFIGSFLSVFIMACKKTNGIEAIDVEELKSRPPAQTMN